MVTGILIYKFSIEVWFLIDRTITFESRSGMKNLKILRSFFKEIALFDEKNELLQQTHDLLVQIWP